MQYFKNIESKPVSIRLIVFLLLLTISWIPFAVPISLLFNNNPNLVTIMTMGLLFILFIFLQRWWGKYLYQKSNIFRDYGLKTNKLSLIYLIKGLAIGFCFCWALFITEAIFGWITISNNSDFLLKVVLEGLLSALLIALAEELVFRGWVLYELEQDCRKSTALWISSLIFAIAHFLKPIGEIIRTLVTFPALFLLGAILVLAKRANKNYLTICIGIHAGLVWGYYILNVGNLVTYTNTVPNCITGIDNNPIAGVLGLSFLSILALVIGNKASS